MSSGAARAPLILGKYALIRRVAVGGMAELYLARQRGVAGFDRLVMLKRLLPELAQKADFVRQFLDEARVVATLSHPGIVAIYEVGEHDGDYFIAMELIRGITLSQRLIAKQPVPLAVAARLIRDAAAGLHHAHQATDTKGRALQIVHRDVSPSNLMVDERGALKVVDFGIAHAAGRLTKTQAGTVKGKWGYMPLEQLAGDQVDARCDQFALGVVFWELCTSKRLFADENMVKLVSDRTVAPPSSLRPEISPPLDSIILRMLAEKPADRFATCHDVVEALDAFAGQEPNYSEAAVARDCDELIETHVASLTHDLETNTDSFAAASQTPLAGVATGTVDLQPGEATTSQLPAGHSRRKPKRIAALIAILVALGVGSIWWSSKNSPERALIEAPIAERPLLGSDAPKPEEASGQTKLVEARPAEDKLTEAPKRIQRKARKRPAVAAKASGHGWLNVDTKPWSEVWVDGKFVGTTPVYKLRLATGTHKLKFVNKKQGLRKNKTLKIVSNKSHKLIEKLQ